MTSEPESTFTGTQRDKSVWPADRLSKRIQAVPPSGIRRFFDLAAEMQGQVLSLSIGEPDFVTPWRIREAGIYSLENGETHYTANRGLLELRAAIAAYMQDRFSLAYDPKREVVVTVGGSEALDNAVRVLCDPGDEAIVPEPSFVSYKASCAMAGVKAVTIDLKKEDQFRLKPEALAAAITPSTRLLILGYPNNPTGAVMERADYKALLPLLKANPQISILSDELYAELNYTGVEHCSPAQFKELYDRTVVVGGFSKSFAMTGWRLGYACGPAPLMEALNKVHQYVIMSSPTTAQHAAVEALRYCLPEVEGMRLEYNGRRRYILKRLEEMGVSCFEPLGAFYIFPDISSYGLTSEEFCERFLKEHKVAIIPGSAFGQSGEGFVRISYAASMETIEAAMDRLQCFTADLKRGI